MSFYLLDMYLNVKNNVFKDSIKKGTFLFLLTLHSSTANSGFSVADRGIRSLSLQFGKFRLSDRPNQCILRAGRVQS